MKLHINLEQFEALDFDTQFEITHKHWNPRMGSLFVSELDKCKEVRILKETVIKKNEEHSIEETWLIDVNGNEFKKSLCIPLLSIEQMIEILHKSPLGRYELTKPFETLKGINGTAFFVEGNPDYELGVDLCDKLFEAVLKLFERKPNADFFKSLCTSLLK